MRTRLAQRICPLTFTEHRDYEWVELYLYSPYMSPWRREGHIYLLTASCCGKYSYWIWRVLRYFNPQTLRAPLNHFMAFNNSLLNPQLLPISSDCYFSHATPCHRFWLYSRFVLEKTIWNVTAHKSIMKCWWKNQNYTAYCNLKLEFETQ